MDALKRDNSQGLCWYHGNSTKEFMRKVTLTPHSCVAQPGCLGVGCLEGLKIAVRLKKTK